MHKRGVAYFRCFDLLAGNPRIQLLPGSIEAQPCTMSVGFPLIDTSEIITRMVAVILARG